MSFLPESGGFVADPEFRLKLFTQSVDFSDLGNGTGYLHPLVDFPTKVIMMAATYQINEVWVGQANLTCQVGDGGGAQVLIPPVNIDGVAVGFVQDVQGFTGSAQLGRFEADFVAAGAQFRLDATDLDLVTAGNLTLHVWYFTPTLQ